MTADERLKKIETRLQNTREVDWFLSQDDGKWLVARVKELESVHNFCGYCKQQFSKGDLGWEELRLHIKTCLSHPVYKLQRQLNFAAGMISTMKRFEKMHPEEVRLWIEKRALE